MWQIKAFPKRDIAFDEQSLIEITSRFTRSRHLDLPLSREIQLEQLGQGGLLGRVDI